MELSELLGALRAPGTPDELARADSTVAAMIAAHAQTTAVVVPLRSIDRRPALVAVGAALGIVGAVLITGTAAAAFSGALPENLQRIAHDVLGAPAPTTLDPSDTGDPGSSGSDKASQSTSRGASEFTETPSSDGSRPAATLDAKALFGLCTAFADNGPDDQSGESVAFKVLSSAASAKDQTIEEYCAPILASKPGGKPTTKPGQGDKPTTKPGQGGKPSVPPGLTDKPTPPGQTKTAKPRPTNQGGKPSTPPGQTRKPVSSRS
jgi:hypothetical protein